MCLAPVTVKAQQYIEGESTSHIAVPCGKCPECITSRRNAWAFRLEQEMKKATSAAFITLTYTNEELPISTNGLVTLNKKHYQNFLKRLRKEIMTEDFKLPQFEKSKYGDKPYQIWKWEHYTTKAGKDKKRKKWLRKIKYFACGEYGTKTQRPHYHAIIFGLPKKYLLDFEYLEAKWTHGAVHIGDCTIPSILYTVSYMLKGGIDHDFVDPETGEVDDRQKEFQLMSKGLGKKFLTPAQIKKILTDKNPFILLAGGQKAKMPRYYKNEILKELDDYERFKFEKAIREKSLEFAEQRDDSTEAEQHNIKWKKDQYRKYQDKLRKERQKI